MFARVTIATAQLGKTEEVTRVMQDYFVALKKQKGFKGGFLLSNRDTGKGMSIVMWNTEADMKAMEANGVYRDVVAKTTALMAGKPTVEHCEVTLQA